MQLDKEYCLHYLEQVFNLELVQDNPFVDKMLADCKDEFDLFQLGFYTKKILEMRQNEQN